MGRPPVGKYAMSGAERQRRYLERLLKSGTSPRRPEHVQQELAQALARIAELEKLLSQQKAVQRPPQQQQWHEQLRNKPSAAELKIMRLQDKVRELESLVLPLDDEGKTAVGQHKRKVNRLFKALWKMNEDLLKKHAVTMSSKDYKLFLAGFHPDAAAEMRDKARIRFETLCKRFVIPDKDKVQWPPKES